MTTREILAGAADICTLFIEDAASLSDTIAQGYTLVFYVERESVLCEMLFSPKFGTQTKEADLKEIHAFLKKRKITAAYIDLESVPEIGSEYHIKSIPTIAAYKNGQ